MLATLCLNEMEWLPKLVEQHLRWPGLACWVFVEAADAAYARTNPGLVTERGLSVDGTTEFLAQLAGRCAQVKHIAFGKSWHEDIAKGKCAARQAYLDVAEEIRPDVLVSIDADEFYACKDQQLVNDVFAAKHRYRSFIFKRREVWRPPSVASEPLFLREAVGGFWNIPCCHWWRWEQGMNHRACHNTPHDISGMPFNHVIYDARQIVNMPQMVHVGFASNRETRIAKNRYYAYRGEKVDPLRRWYVKSRMAWETWAPGKDLPNGAKVVDYDGPIPEVFR